MSGSLDPKKPGRKGIVLYGIGGSGKTQLARQYIELNGSSFSSVIWINASTNELMRETFTEALDMISAYWPQDLPNASTSTDSSRRVVTRLRSTLHKDWLYVIDSLDDLDGVDCTKLVPACLHGSIIITTTKSQATEVLQLTGLEVDRMSIEDARQLLLARFTSTKSINEFPQSGKLKL